ncbi:MAG: enzyme repeat-containing protein [Planctomycetota bacterium]|nr:enzyme repeat-containing protein [Planctomycetota bacterium]
MAVWILAAPALVQAADEQLEKVSNDRPDRPLQMPAASSETKEAFDDFERFARRGSWERATKALYAIPEAQAGRFVDGQDGFIISVARKRRAVLSGLSPEGQAAYRLFYDADAKKLLEQAKGPSEQATLERLYSSYFLSSAGDNAADRLGDLYFEQGQFDRAADCWLAVLGERTDSEISPAVLTVKAALALARAGRRPELDAIRAEMADRYADEVVTIGGRKAKGAEHLRGLLGDPGLAKGPDPASAATAGLPPALPEAVPAAWQLRFAASVTAGMTALELTQWEATSFSGAVPPAAVAGQTLYVNYLGHVFAVDLASGKMLWRSASFHNLEQGTMQGQSQMIDPKRFAILAAPGFVWTLGRDLKEMNYQAVSRLVCRRAENGEIEWQSSDIPDFAGIDLAGVPILARGVMFVAGKSSNSMSYGQDNTPHQFVLAIRPHDGKLLWKTDVGVFREGQRYYYYGMGDSSPQPRLVYRAGSVYIDTHNGILGRLDAESGTLEWGYGYPTEPAQSQYGRMIFFNGMPSPTSSQGAASAPLAAGDAILVKGAKSDRICALDPDRMKLLWDRPIARSARLIGADAQGIYLGGPELGALDPKTRVLRWSTALPGGSDDGQVLVRPDGLWQFTPRGVFEVDPQSGRVRRIFRGDDAGSAGGDLMLTDGLLVAISNRTISAYPRGSAGAAQASRGGVAAPKTGGSND